MSRLPYQTFLKLIQDATEKEHSGNRDLVTEAIQNRVLSIDISNGYHAKLFDVESFNVIHIGPFASGTTWELIENLPKAVEAYRKTPDADLILDLLHLL